MVSNSTYATMVVPPNVITPYFRVRANTTTYNPSGGGIAWLGSSTGTGFTLVGGTQYSTPFTNFHTLPVYISPTDETNIFTQERWGVYSLTVPVPNGLYMARYYVGEYENTTPDPNNRRFNILINGDIVQSNFSPKETFGIRELGYLEYVVNVTSGSIVVSTTSIIGNPIWNAIEFLTLT